MKPPHFIPLPRLTVTGLCIMLLSFTLGQGCSAPAAPAQAAAGQPAAQPVQQPVHGIWLAPAEIAALPMAGPAWEQLKNAADQAIGHPDLSNQDTTVNTTVLAKALVFPRTGEAKYRQEVVAALTALIEEKTEENGRTLALGRELVAYVVAADLIALRTYEPALNQRFEARLRELLTKPIAGWGIEPKSLRATHEERPNNWGTHAGASRAAIALYLGDYAELERTAQVFHGYLGARASYHDFEYGADLSWQLEPTQPVGINPVGAQKAGQNIDGALPEEMRRGAKFRWPPKRTNYAWGAMQGVLVQASLLRPAGYPVWEWEDQAILRAVQFLYRIDWQPKGDDQWMVWLINAVYQTDYPTAAKVNPGKNMGWTNWTHARP